jgi:hypothetical protein
LDLVAHRDRKAADILGGRRVGIRIDATALSCFDPDTRQLLRNRPDLLNPDEVGRMNPKRHDQRTISSGRAQ